MNLLAMTVSAPKHRQRWLLLAVLFHWSVAVGHAAPNWFADAVWYQIFPERFRNGDPSNDPVRSSLFPITTLCTNSQIFQVLTWL